MLHYVSGATRTVDSNIQRYHYHSEFQVHATNPRKSAAPAFCFFYYDSLRLPNNGQANHRAAQTSHH